RGFTPGGAEEGYPDWQTMDLARGHSNTRVPGYGGWSSAIAQAMVAQNPIGDMCGAGGGRDQGIQPMLRHEPINAFSSGNAAAGCQRVNIGFIRERPFGLRL